MPRNEVVLQIFVASPDELAPERTVLAQVIEELNSLWARSLGVRLELIRWETHAFPSFGEDAQDVINRQLPADYDLFIGIMWARFGTATARAGSGTVEEFENALARRRSSPEAVQLMMYFKDAAKPLSEIDPEQLQSVNEFRKRVETEGGLHWPFSGPDDFAVNLRIHLTRFVQGWQPRVLNAAAQNAVDAEGGSSGPAELVQTSEEEIGFIDLVENTIEALAAVLQTQERMTGIATEFAATLRARTGEMVAAGQSPSGLSSAAVKRITNALADDMEQFARRLRVEQVQFARQLDDALVSTGTVATLAVDFGEDSSAARALPALATQVEAFGSAIRTNADVTTSLRNTIATSPRITTAYNRARKMAVGALDETIRVFSEASDTSLRVAQGILELTLGQAG